MRTSIRFRTRTRALIALLATLTLIAAACSGDGTDTAENNDPAPVDDAPEPEDEPEEEEEEPEPEEDEPEPEPEPEPEEPAGPDVRTLSLMPDPVGSTDPLETVNHLPSVQVFTADEGIAFVFDSLPEVGNRILIAPGDVEIWCDMWPEGESLRVECGGYVISDGTFLNQVPIPQVDMALGYGFIVPMTISGGMVTITHDGTDYSAPQVRVAQEPAFVQIDVNTGGLAAEVVRTVGIATGAELEAALS